MNLKEALLKAYQNGYRIKDGIVYNPNGKILSGTLCSDGYIMFAPTKVDKVFIHRLVAYQKYGDKIFEEGIEVRHKDNDKLNNFDDNIIIGTHKENMMDISKKERSKNAGNQSRKHPHEEIINFYNETRSYKQTMDKFGITSKGTLNYIIKKSMTLDEMVASHNGIGEHC